MRVYACVALVCGLRVACVVGKGRVREAQGNEKHTSKREWLAGDGHAYVDAQLKGRGVDEETYAVEKVFKAYHPSRQSLREPLSMCTNRCVHARSIAVWVSVFDCNCLQVVGGRPLLSPGPSQVSLTLLPC